MDRFARVLGILSGKETFQREWGEISTQKRKGAMGRGLLCVEYVAQQQNRESLSWRGAKVNSHLRSL